jgi:hypothetical protein
MVDEAVEGGEAGGPGSRAVPAIVSQELVKEQNRQRKFHSKKGTRKPGRSKGSKAKMEGKKKISKSDSYWD